MKINTRVYKYQIHIKIPMNFILNEKMIKLNVQFWVFMFIEEYKNKQVLNEYNLS